MLDGDPKQFWRLFQEYRTDLLRFFRNRVHCQQTALDLCQEAFLRVFVAASTGEWNIRAATCFERHSIS